MKEIDDVNERVNCCGQEVKEIDEVMKNLLDCFSKMEEKVCILEEEGLAREEMIASLQVKVEDLQTKICCCNKPES